MRWVFHLLRQIAIAPRAWQDASMRRTSVILLVAVLAVAVPFGASAGVHESSSPWGHTGEGTVEIYKLTNAHGVEARVMTYGATLVSLTAPDRSGQFKNIVLGFEALEPYLAAGVPYYGATVGRYANRIAKARFTLDGKTYQLAANDGPNTLHGGKRGFDKRIWKAEVLPASQGGGVRMTLVSAAGEEGYPGEVTVPLTRHSFPRVSCARLLEHRSTSARRTQSARESVTTTSSCISVAATITTGC
jgi:aldose 1-epimerase